MAKNTKFFNPAIRLKPNALTIDSAGELQFNIADNKLYLHDGTTAAPLLTSVTPVFGSFLTLPEIATPGSTPPATFDFLYFKAPGQLFAKDDANIEYQIGGLGYSLQLEFTNTRTVPYQLLATPSITSPLFQRTIKYVQGNGAARTITANPRIAAGTMTEQELVVVGCSDTNTITLLNGNGLKVNGSIVLGADDAIGFIWDGTNWSESWRNN